LKERYQQNKNICCIF